MKLSVVRGGGLPGLVTRTELASDALPAERAQELRAKVDQAGLLGTAGSPPPDAPPAYPDELAYQLEVTGDDGATHTYHATESTLPEPVRQLIAWVDSAPEKAESIAPPGS
jgi:hypothetical protein